MKNTIATYLSKFLLVSAVLSIVFIVFLYSGPRILYSKFLTMEVSQQYATVTKIIEENHVTTENSEHYDYDIIIDVNVDGDVHDVEFKLTTVEPIYVGTDYLVEYYNDYTNCMLMYYNADTKIMCEQVSSAKKYLFMIVPIAVLLICFIVKISKKSK